MNFNYHKISIQRMYVYATANLSYLCVLLDTLEIFPFVYVTFGNIPHMLENSNIFIKNSTSVLIV